MKLGPGHGPFFAQARSNQDGKNPAPPNLEQQTPGPRRGLTRLALILGGLVFAAGAAVLFWSHPQPLSPSKSFIQPQTTAPYEEPPFGSPAKDDSVLRLDEALFTGLRQAGVSLDEISLRQAMGTEHKMVEGLVRLPPGPPARVLAEALAGRLRRAGAGVEIRAFTGGTELWVSLSGKPTHSIRLADPQAPGRAPLPLRDGPEGHRLALVIDDLGYHLAPAQELLATGLNFTFSILPGSPHGKRIAEMARQHGVEVLVHMPMEPRSYPKLSPGPGALLTAMTPQKIRAQTLANLDAVPNAKGVNNHMGSRFTEDPVLLELFMAVLKERRMFFLDSLTSPRSQGHSVARRLGVPSLRREIFLDHDQGEAQVLAQIERLMGLGKRHDGVIAIAHPHPATIKILTRLAPRLKKQVNMVPLSRLMHNPPAIQAATLSRSKAPKLR